VKTFRGLPYADFQACLKCDLPRWVHRDQGVIPADHDFVSLSSYQAGTGCWSRVHPSKRYPEEKKA